MHQSPQYRQIIIVAAGKEPFIIDHWTLLQKSNSEEALWKIVPRGTKFGVKFDKGDGTPFNHEEFAGTDAVASGPIKADPQDPPKAYRYSVTVEGCAPLDPGIIIWDRH